MLKLRRSVSSKVGETLLRRSLDAAEVMCDDERCCSNGADSMLDQRCHHAGPVSLSGAGGY